MTPDKIMYHGKFSSSFVDFVENDGKEFGKYRKNISNM